MDIIFDPLTYPAIGSKEWWERYAAMNEHMKNPALVAEIAQREERLANELRRIVKKESQ